MRLDITSGTTQLSFLLKVCANKLKYYANKLKEFNQDIIRINPKLPTTIKEALTQEGFCNSPLAIQMITGKDKYIYSNVEFNFD